MSMLFDTSSLIPVFVESHPLHDRATGFYVKALSARNKIFVSSHVLAECYSVLTKIPFVPRITPTMARQMIKNNLIAHMEVVTLSAKDYLDVLEQLALLDLSGGIIYDALIFRAAKKVKANKLVTFNVRDFERINVDNQVKIIEP